MTMEPVKLIVCAMHGDSLLYTSLYKKLFIFQISAGRNATKRLSEW
jgi:hypothetical protein